MKKIPKINKFALLVVVILVFFGFFIFLSATLGSNENQETVISILIRQTFIGILGGSIFCYLFSKINYLFFKKYAFWIFIFSVVLTACVFIPAISYSHGGARRWLDFGFISFQPVEILKIAYLIYLAAFFSHFKKSTSKFLFSFGSFLAISLVPVFILFKQPDMDSILILILAGLSIVFMSEIPLRKFALAILCLIVAFGGIAFTKPYILDRVKVFIDPSLDPFGQGYHVRQSLIAIGSGGINGRGFGKSLQKSEFLPEPMGDSIFAVFSEEFGLIGSFLLVLMYILFGIAGFKIASQAKDDFGKFLAVGLTSLIVFQAFLNIASMLGIFILSGLPLPFISHGGTALFAHLISAGILFNISRYTKKT